jgi:TPR repeat protein
MAPKPSRLDKANKVRLSLIIIIGMSLIVMLGLKEGQEVPPDPFQNLLSQAGQGDADAQLSLGEKYAKGEGVAKDPVEAARWFRRAAEVGGNAIAQNSLGEMYARGDGVPQNEEEAA